MQSIPAGQCADMVSRVFPKTTEIDATAAGRRVFTAFAPKKSAPATD
jgi:hypothetical protein